MTKKISGYILWEGKSRIDGSPITAVATMKSANDKTGNMVQVWILRSDINPIEACQTGKDFAICGNCPQRHALNGGCYVNVKNAPRSVYASLKKGNYTKGIPDFSGRVVRLGAYGDPAAVPMKVWDKVLKGVKKFTGYSHQWKRFPAITKYCMASVENQPDTIKAQSKGMRTFRILGNEDIKLKTEMACLNATKGLQCIDCGLCNGANKRKSIVIHGHGFKTSKIKH